MEEKGGKREGKRRKGKGESERGKKNLTEKYFDVVDPGFKH